MILHVYGGQRGFLLGHTQAQKIFALTVKQAKAYLERTSQFSVCRFDSDVSFPFHKLFSMENYKCNGHHVDQVNQNREKLRKKLEEKQD